MFSITLLCFLLTASLCTREIQTEHRDLNFIWDSLFNFNKKNEQEVSKTPTTITKCIGCSNRLEEVDEEKQIEEELTLLRIEYIKQQILKKLRLKEKPAVSLPIAGLPKPVTEDESLFPRSQDDLAEKMDHYYGKTTQAIIFPYEGLFIYLFI